MKRALLMIGMMAFGPAAIAQILTSRTSTLGISHHVTTDDGLNTNLTTAVAQTSDGVIWIGTSSGLHRYDGFTVQVLTDTLLTRLGTARIGRILSAGEHLVVQTDSRSVGIRASGFGEIEFLEAGSWPAAQLERDQALQVAKWAESMGLLQPDSTLDLSRAGIRTLEDFPFRSARYFADAAGGLLVAHPTEGLYRLVPPDYQLYEYFLEGAEPIYVGQIIAGPEGYTLGGGNGIWRLSSLSGSGRKILAPEFPIQRSDNGDLWFHGGDGRFRWTGDGRVQRWQTQRALVPGGRVWAQGFYWYTTDEYLFRASEDGSADSLRIAPGVIALFAQESGRVWALGNRVDSCSITECTPVVAPDAFVGQARYLWEDAEGVCWVGTYGGGLALFTCSGDDGRYRRLGTRDGLPDDFVNSIHPMGEGRILLGTNAGLHWAFRDSVLAASVNPDGRLHMTTLRGPLPGRQRIETNGGATTALALDPGSGDILMPTVRGVVRVNPDLPAPSTGLPAPQIWEVSIPGGPPLPVTNRGARLSSDRRTVRIALALPSLALSENVHLQYKVDSGPWQTTVGRELTLYNLTAGSHSVWLRSKPSWGAPAAEVREFRIYAVPRLTETLLFKAFVFLSLALALAIWVVRKARRDARYRLELERAVQERTRQLTYAVARSQADNETIVEQASQLVNADLRRRQFLKRLATEIRLPASIVGLRLLEYGADEQMRRDIESQLSEVHRLARDLQWRSGQAREELEVVEVIQLDALVRECVVSASVLARGKRLDVEFFPSGDDPLRIVADRDRLTHIVQSLLSIGIRSAPSDGQPIEVELIQVGNAAVFSVTVPTPNDIELDVDSVFDPFLLGRTEESAAYAGLGLGLAVAREFAEGLGGTLTMDQSAGHRSFSFRVPLGIPELGLPSTPEASPSLSGLMLTGKDYIADFMREALASMVRLERLHPSGLPAHQSILASDLFVFEGQQGLSVVRKLRELPEGYSTICVLVAPPDGDRTILEEALAVGTDAVLRIPLAPEVVQSRIASLINLRRRVTASSSSETFGRAAARIVEEHLHDPDFDVKRLASELNLSYSQLARRLRASLDENPTALIRRIRVEKAAELLGVGHPKITEIAFAVGFKSLSHFNRAFREVHGQSPTEFIRNRGVD